MFTLRTWSGFIGGGFMESDRVVKLTKRVYLNCVDPNQLTTTVFVTFRCRLFEPLVSQKLYKYIYCLCDHSIIKFQRTESAFLYLAADGEG